MHHGYRIVEDMIDGLAGYLAGRGLASPADLVGRVLPRIGDWGELDLSYAVKARIDAETCIHCNLCYRACEDGARQAIILSRTNGHSTLSIDDAESVGCRLCERVCPVDGSSRWWRSRRRSSAQGRAAAAGLGPDELAATR